MAGGIGTVYLARDRLAGAAALGLAAYMHRWGVIHRDLKPASMVGQAVQQLGREEAFRTLGRENLLKNRNHHKVLKRELEKVEALYKELGEGPSPFASLLAEDEAA